MAVAFCAELAVGFVNDVLVVRTAGAVVVVVVGFAVRAGEGRTEALPAVFRRNKPAFDPAAEAVVAVATVGLAMRGRMIYRYGISSICSPRKRLLPPRQAYLRPF